MFLSHFFFLVFFHPCPLLPYIAYTKTDPKRCPEVAKELVGCFCLFVCYFVSPVEWVELLA